MVNLCMNAHIVVNDSMGKTVYQFMFTSSIPHNNFAIILDMKDITVMLNSYIEKCPEIGGKSYRCTLCNQINSDKSSAVKHVENIHFAGQLTYSCKYCDKVFSARNNMYVHISRNHK